MKMPLTKRRLVVLVLDILISFYALSQAGYLPFSPFAPKSQPPPPLYLQLFYPPTNGAGIYLGNPNNVNFIDITVLVVSNQTVTEGSPVYVDAYGCLTERMAAGLQEVIVAFPQAEALNGIGSFGIGGASGYGVILHPVAQASIYCNPYVGKMYYLVGNSTNLKWLNQGDYSPTMTAQYVNGTKRIAQTSDFMAVQSSVALASLIATQRATDLALGGFLIVIIGAVNRATKPKK